MFKAGFYEADITPPLGCSIPGYFMKRTGCDVWDRLYAKAAVFDDGKEKTAFLMVDKLFVDSEERDKIYDRIEELSEIKRENVIVFATHTHNGGSCLKNNIYNTEIDMGYIENFVRIAADSVILAEKRMKPAKLRFGSGRVDSISFVRNFFMKDGNIRSNPGRLNPDIIKPISEIDPDFPILTAEDESGRLFGALAGFSCHNCCVGGTVYSSDYSGVLAAELKKVYGDGFICVFLNGFCGNLNHHDVTKEFDPEFKYYIPMGKTLAAEFVRMVNTGLCAIEGEIKVREENIKIRRREIPEDELSKMRDLVKGEQPEGYLDLAFPESPQMKYYNAKTLLNMYDGSPAEMDVQLKVVRIGDCSFFASPGEMFNQFAQIIKEDSDTDKNFMIELANGDPCCYVPVRELFGTTAYEGFYMSALMIPDAGYIIADTLLKIQKSL